MHSRAELVHNTSSVTALYNHRMVDTEDCYDVQPISGAIEKIFTESEVIYKRKVL